ncbi:MAG: hypothetical protein ABEH83_03015 [Halobacterium sp.]
MTRPGTISGAAAVVAAAFSVVLAGVDAFATVVGATGLLCVAAGVVERRRSPVTLGAALLGVATLAGGAAGAGTAAVVAAACAAMVAWTLGQTSAALASTDAAARTVALELTHVAGTTAVAGVAAGVALAPRAVDFDASPLGLALVVVGGLALTAAVAVPE